jgi:uncharacterized membrane protein HdeD (DUF308 family)
VRVAMGASYASTLSTAVTGNSWAIALRGVAALLLGVLTFLMPNVTLAALVTVLGAYFLVDGLFAIAAAVRGLREHERWGWMLAQGIIGVVAGLIALFTPAIGALALTWLVAGWALATGVFEIAAAIRLRKVMTGEWLLLLAGVLSVILGFVVALFPGIGALLLVSWVGAFALIYGIVNLALAVRIKQWTRANA